VHTYAKVKKKLSSKLKGSDKKSMQSHPDNKLTNEPTKTKT